MFSWKLLILLVLFNISQARRSEDSEDDATSYGWIGVGSNGYQYKIFAKKVTWKEAVNECKEMNTGLAVFYDTRTGWYLAQELEKAKIFVNTAWIDTIIYEQKSSNEKDGCLMLGQHQKGRKDPFYTTAPCNDKADGFICYKNDSQNERKRRRKLDHLVKKEEKKNKSHEKRRSSTKHHEKKAKKD